MTISMNFSGLSALNQKRFINLHRDSISTPAVAASVRTKGNISVSTAVESMSHLASAAVELGSPEAFLATAASSSSTDVVRVSASGKALVGQHTLEITQMATKQVTTATSGYASTADVAADGGSISFSVNGSTTAAISVSSSTTLSELKDQINNQNSGVVASIKNDGINNRLVVSSRQSGKGQGFTINNSLTNSSGTAIQFETGQSSISGNSQNAGNAHFTLNGTDFNKTSNAIGDVIDGVTLTLAGKGSATVTVSSDHSRVAAEAGRFVNEFNRVDAAATNMSDPKSSYRDRVTLGTALWNVSQTTRDAVGGSREGRFKSLADLGFTFKKSGELKLDKSKLNAALKSDAASVKKLFVGDPVEKGVFAELSASLGIHNSAAGTMHRARIATNIINAGSANISGVAPRSGDLAYIKNIVERANESTGTRSTRINVRA